MDTTLLPAQFAQQQIAALSQQVTSLNDLIRHYEAIIAATGTPAAVQKEAPVRRRRAHGEFKRALVAALGQVGKVGATVDELKTDIEQRLASEVSRSHVSVELKKLEANGRARRSGKLWSAHV